MNTYSFSKVNCYYSCPLGFYKKYFNEEKGDSHGTSEFGSFVHKILELYAKGELKIEDMPDYYDMYFDEEVVSDFNLKITEDFSKNMHDLYYKNGKEYLENFKGFDENLEILEVEYDFTEDVEGLFYFTGKIDLVCKDKTTGDLIIIDHKSKGKFVNKAEQSEYAKQLYVYSYAIYKKYGKFPTKLCFNMFRIGKWIEIPFNIDRYNEVMEWLKYSVKEIENAWEFLPINGTFYCNNFCQFRNQNCKDCLLTSN